MNKNKFSLSQLNEEGYTGPIDVLSAEEARFGRESFYKSIGQNESNPGPLSVKTGGFNLKHKWAHDISINNKILDYTDDQTRGITINFEPFLQAPHLDTP